VRALAQTGWELVACSNRDQGERNTATFKHIGDRLHRLAGEIEIKKCGIEGSLDYDRDSCDDSTDGANCGIAKVLD
jgi:hypothetical protein